MLKDIFHSFLTPEKVCCFFTHRSLHIGAGILGMIIMWLFSFQYLNRWSAGLNALVPPNDSANFVVVGVTKLDHGLRLYNSSKDCPSDFLYGPFPCVGIFGISELLPGIDASLISHASALGALLCASLSIGGIAGILSLRSNHTITQSAFIATLAITIFFALAPKRYFVSYHHEPICVALMFLSILFLTYSIGRKPSALTNLLIGALCAAAFLTKSSYLSLTVASVIFFILQNNFFCRFVWFVFGFAIVSLIVIIPFCEPASFFWWTLVLPFSTPKLAPETLTAGINFPIVFSFFSAMAASMITIKLRLESKSYLSLCLCFACIVSFFALGPLFKIGGGMQTLVNPIFSWFPVLIPGFIFLLERAGPAFLLVIAPLSIQLDIPSAREIRNFTSARTEMAKQLASKFPDAIYLTRGNWPCLLNKSVPEFVFPSVADLSYAIPNESSKKIIEQVQKKTHQVITDDFFYFHTSSGAMAPWVPNRESSPIAKILQILNSEYTVVKNYGLSESHTEDSSPGAKVWVPK